jgi:hypothetical protein
LDGALDKKPAFMERRTHPRRRVKEGAFAVLPADFKLGQIEDISRGGLAFCYVPIEELKDDTVELEIYFVADKFNLKRIPFETVSDYPIDENLPFNYVERRRRHLKFGDLDAVQQMQLEYFIKNYTD